MERIHDYFLDEDTLDNLKLTYNEEDIDEVIAGMINYFEDIFQNRPASMFSIKFSKEHKINNSLTHFYFEIDAEPVDDEDYNLKYLNEIFIAKLILEIDRDSYVEDYYKPDPDNVTDEILTLTKVEFLKESIYVQKQR